MQGSKARQIQEADLERIWTRSRRPHAGMPHRELTLEPPPTAAPVSRDGGKQGRRSRNATTLHLMEVKRQTFLSGIIVLGSTKQHLQLV